MHWWLVGCSMSWFNIMAPLADLAPQPTCTEGLQLAVQLCAGRLPGLGSWGGFATYVAATAGAAGPLCCPLACAALALGTTRGARRNWLAVGAGRGISRQQQQAVRGTQHTGGCGRSAWLHKREWQRQIHRRHRQLCCTACAGKGVPYLMCCRPSKMLCSLSANKPKH